MAKFLDGNGLSTALGYIRRHFASVQAPASYLTFVTNTTRDAIDAAMGKNNPDFELGLGVAFSRYAKFKGSTGDLSVLEQCESLNDIKRKPDALAAAFEDDNIKQLIAFNIQTASFADNFFDAVTRKNIVANPGTVNFTVTAQNVMNDKIYFNINSNAKSDYYLNGVKIEMGAEEGFSGTKQMFISLADYNITDAGTYEVTFQCRKQIVASDFWKFAICTI